MLNKMVLLNPKSYVFTEIKENSAAQKAHNVGPPTACQRYAISMAYTWWAVDGPTLCASWNGDLMTFGRIKRRQYFVSKWFVNLHLTVIFSCYMYIHVVDVNKDRIFFLFSVLRPAKHKRRCDHNLQEAHFL